MAGFTDGAAAVASFAEEVETGSFTPSGSNRLAFAIAAAGGPFSTPDPPNNVRIGGSGGTALTLIGSAVNEGGVQAVIARLIAPAASSQTGYQNGGGLTISTGLCMLCFDGVDQTTPLGTAQIAQGTSTGVDTVTATRTVTGVSAGVEVLWGVVFGATGNDIADVVGLGDAGLLREALESGFPYMAIAGGMRTAPGGSFDIQVRCDAAGASDISWIIFAIPINDAAGGGVTVTPDAGAATITGQAPTAVRTDNHTAAPGAGSATLTGHAPTAATTANVVEEPGAGSAVFTGQAPSAVVTANVIEEPGAGALTIAGHAPTAVVTANVVVEPGAGALTATGHAPAATTGGNVVAQPEAGALVLTGHAPTAARTDNQTAQPDRGQLVISGHAPTALVDSFARPGAAELAITGYGPQIIVTANQVVQPGAGALTFEGHAPEARLGSPVAEPGAGELALQGYAPTAVVTGQETVLDPKYAPRNKNVQFKPLKRKKRPEPVAAAPAPKASGLLLGLVKAAGLGPRPMPAEAAPAPVEASILLQLATDPAPIKAPAAQPAAAPAPPAAPEPVAAPVAAPAPPASPPDPLALALATVAALEARMEAMATTVRVLTDTVDELRHDLDLTMPAAPPAPDPDLEFDDGPPAPAPAARGMTPEQRRAENARRAKALLRRLL